MKYMCIYVKDNWKRKYEEIVVRDRKEGLEAMEGGQQRWRRKGERKGILAESKWKRMSE